MPTPGHNDNALGLLIRIGIPIALLIAAYLVAFCPCDTLLACDSHGPAAFVTPYHFWYWCGCDGLFGHLTPFWCSLCVFLSI